jgi:hypothetical protein
VAPAVGAGQLIAVLLTVPDDDHERQLLVELGADLRVRAVVFVAAFDVGDEPADGQLGGDPVTGRAVGPLLE